MISADATKWFSIASGRGFHGAGIHADIQAPADARVWTYDAAAALEHVGDDAPMGLWPGAGDGRVRAPLLRAHPLAIDGAIDVSPGSVFGRTLTYATAELQRWLARPRLARIGVATFIDVARADRVLAGVNAQQEDIGVGLRIRVPGLGRILRVDYGHGLRDGKNAVTVGWVYQR